jgi:hypothetical protein
VRVKTKSPEVHPRRHPRAADTDTQLRRGDEVRHLLGIRRRADVEIRLALREHRGHDQVNIRLFRQGIEEIERQLTAEGLLP